MNLEHNYNFIFDKSKFFMHVIIIILKRKKENLTFDLSKPNSKLD
jgi:hypothetical protein